MSDLQGEVGLDGRPRPRYPLPRPDLGTAGRWFESSCPDHFCRNWNCDPRCTPIPSRAFLDTMKNPNSPRVSAYLELGPSAWPRAWRSAIGTALLLALFLALNCWSMTEVLHNSYPGHPNFWSAVGATLLLAALIPLFALARFSF
jgi:hypothetical protein